MTLARFATALLLAATAAGCGGADHSPEAVADSLSATWQVRWGGVERVTCVERNADAFDCGLDQKDPVLGSAFHHRVRLRLDGDCWRTVATGDGDPKLRGCLAS